MEKLEGFSPDVHIGSLISLTSKSEIRYEGSLFTLDTEKSTIVLKDVRSFGTEGRGRNILHISASNKIYEYIIFRDTDIKDLSVLAFLGNFDKPIKAVLESNGHMQYVKELAEKSNSHSLEIALGWPVSPQPSCAQGDAIWWHWLWSPAPSSYNVMPPSAPLATVPTDVHIETLQSFPSSSKQGKYGPSVIKPLAQLAQLEQVPVVIPVNVCKTHSSEVSQQPSGDFSASGKNFITGTFKPRMLLQGEKGHLKPVKVQPLLQQPLLPLPVSETEHQRLIRENTCSANLEHLRRPRVRLRRARGTRLRHGDPLRTCCEASYSTQEFSKDFDFEAMNEHFNKNEIWHDLDLNERQATNTDEVQSDTLENISNTKTNICCPSRKLRFVDGFFDRLSSDDGECKEARDQETKLSKQRQIDLETFGVSSRPRRGCRNGLQRGAMCRGRHLSITSQGIIDGLSEASIATDVQTRCSNGDVHHVSLSVL